MGVLPNIKPSPQQDSTKPRFAKDSQQLHADRRTFAIEA
jgi:hypothetical protein